MFTLKGHTDYIRTVQFHHELPWILSCSDDQTIRIWNWLNRTLLTTATGHEHYVMSAFFHPTSELIVSSSLDQTIRVWDYSVLRKKYYEARSTSLEVISMDISVKFKIEGHERGVNWAQFHPTLPLIASGSDDKTVRIWKYSDTKWNEADILRGHHNNVSSVVFHPTQDFLISNSEDKSIRIWDLNKKISIEKIVKDQDRFWVLAVHPHLNIFASGNDSGFSVFKIEDFRLPAFYIQNQAFFYSNKAIKQLKVGEKDEKPICDTKNVTMRGLRHGISSLLVNPFVNVNQILNVLVNFDESYQKKVLLFNLKYENNKYSSNENVLELMTHACFLSNNKIIALSENGNLSVFDINILSNKLPLVLANLTSGKEKIEGIFQGPLGKILISFSNGVVGLLDANTKRITQETNEITDLKFVVWTQNFSLGACVSKNSIYIINKNLEILFKIKENSKILSVAFDDNQVLFYSTDFHIKYCLHDGLSGIIKSTENGVYLMMINGNTLYYSDSLQKINVDSFSYVDVRFKLALSNKNYDDVVNLLKSGTIFGLKAIDDIKNAGFPDLALKFEIDPKQKFNLALQSGKLDEAKNAAIALDQKEYYNRLADKAMMIGNISVNMLYFNVFFRLLSFVMLRAKILINSFSFIC